MTLLKLFHTIASVATCASILPVVVGLIEFKRRPAAFRVLWGWLAFGLMINLSMAALVWQHIKTVMLVQLTLPFFAAFGLYAIGRLSASASIRRWCTVASVGYVIFWGVRFLLDEASRDFSLFTAPVLWMILTVASATLVRARLAASPPNVFRDPVLITALAILVMNAPGAALDPVSAALGAKHPELMMTLWVAKAGLMIVATILFTMVFYWTLPPRSSPGFSSSVASPPAR